VQFEILEADRQANPERGDYQKYGYIWRELLKREKLKTILDQSKKENFQDWVVETIQK
jgi:hypothetical protein